MKKGMFVFLSIMLLVSLVMIGCGKTTTTTAPPTSSTTTTTAPPATSTPKTTAPPASSAVTATTTTPTSTQPAASTSPVATAPQTGGTLRIASFEEIPQIGEPVTQTYSSGVLVIDTILEPLLRLDENGLPEPWLATDWKMDTTALTLTLNLRKGVKFHDGTDFNATAAKWNLDRCIAAKKSELASVTSVDIVDDYTIKLNLSRTDGVLTTFLAGIRALMISPTAFQKAADTDAARSKWAEQNPIGTGPFMLVSRERDVKTVLKKNPNYWQPGKPYLDGIVYTPFADQSTLMADFRAGNYDIMLTHQNQDVKVLEQTGKYSIIKQDAGLVGGLEGDSKHPDSPWANIKVRQAAQYSIDAKPFVDTIGYGYWQVTNQFAPPNRWDYNPSVTGYPYNPTKAKQLLSEAGYPDGFKTTIYGMEQYATMMASLQASFKAVGIDAQAQVVTPEKRVQMFGSIGWDGVWIWECTIIPNALYQMNRNFTAAAAPTRMISVDVPAAYSAMVSQAASETDPDKQKQLVWQLQKDLVDTYAFITPFYASMYPVVTVKKFHNWQLNTQVNNSPSEWWLEK